MTKVPDSTPKPWLRRAAILAAAAALGLAAAGAVKLWRGTRGNDVAPTVADTPVAPAVPDRRPPPAACPSTPSLTRDEWRVATEQLSASAAQRAAGTIPEDDTLVGPGKLQPVLDMAVTRMLAQGLRSVLDQHGLDSNLGFNVPHGLGRVVLYLVDAPALELRDGGTSALAHLGAHVRDNCLTGRVPSTRASDAGALIVCDRGLLQALDDAASAMKPTKAYDDWAFATAAGAVFSAWRSPAPGAKPWLTLADVPDELAPIALLVSEPGQERAMWKAAGTWVYSGPEVGERTERWRTFHRFAVRAVATSAEPSLVFMEGFKSVVSAASIAFLLWHELEHALQPATTQMPADTCDEFGDEAQRTLYARYAATELEADRRAGERTLASVLYPCDAHLLSQSPWHCVEPDFTPLMGALNALRVLFDKATRRVPAGCEPPLSLPAELIEALVAIPETKVVLERQGGVTAAMFPLAHPAPLLRLASLGGTTAYTVDLMYTNVNGAAGPYQRAKAWYCAARHGEPMRAQPFRADEATAHAIMKDLDDVRAQIAALHSQMEALTHAPTEELRRAAIEAVDRVRPTWQVGGERLPADLQRDRESLEDSLMNMRVRIRDELAMLDGDCTAVWECRAACLAHWLKLAEVATVGSQMSAIRHLRHEGVPADVLRRLVPQGFDGALSPPEGVEVEDGDTVLAGLASAWRRPLGDGPPSGSPEGLLSEPPQCGSVSSQVFLCLSSSAVNPGESGVVANWRGVQATLATCRRRASTYVLRHAWRLASRVFYETKSTDILDTVSTWREGVGSDAFASEARSCPESWCNYLQLLGSAGLRVDARCGDPNAYCSRMRDAQGADGEERESLVSRLVASYPWSASARALYAQVKVDLAEQIERSLEITQLQYRDLAEQAWHDLGSAIEEKQQAADFPKEGLVSMAVMRARLSNALRKDAAFLGDLLPLHTARPDLAPALDLEAAYLLASGLRPPEPAGLDRGTSIAPGALVVPVVKGLYEGLEIILRHSDRTTGLHSPWITDVGAPAGLSGVVESCGGRPIRRCFDLRSCRTGEAAVVRPIAIESIKHGWMAVQALADAFGGELPRGGEIDTIFLNGALEQGTVPWQSGELHACLTVPPRVASH